jgi:hypothetical protein
MTDREKILIALREKPLKAFEIMKRVNIKFDIHKGHWLAS